MMQSPDITRLLMLLHKRINSAPPRPKRRGWCKIDYDERVRIRMRADEAKGDSQRFPTGFVMGLAAEYRVSDATIYNILQGER